MHELDGCARPIAEAIISMNILGTRLYIHFFFTILERRADLSVYTITQLLAAQLANTQVPDSPTVKIKELRKFLVPEIWHVS